jgi:uncharacterized protein YigE (DUF2233 family)
MTCRTILALLLVWGWLLRGLEAEGGEAERAEFLGCHFITYRVDPDRDQLWLCWKDAAGKPLGSFSRVRKHLAGRAGEVQFAINAGIYSTDYVPLGLHAEEFKMLCPLNTNNDGNEQFNFHLKPNGVFYMAAGRPGILETGAYARQGIEPELACQSGPMLVIDGAIHPAFRPGSTNLHWRSGVGVNASNQVVFALSLQRLCFHDFARLFKEKLGCHQALYLDGDICAIYLPELGYRDDGTSRFAGMFAVTAKQPKQQPSKP